MVIMVLILDGNSEIGTHAQMVQTLLFDQVKAVLGLGSEICNLTS